MFLVYDKLEVDPCALLIDGFLSISLQDSVAVARILHYLIIKYCNFSGHGQIPEDADADWLLNELHGHSLDPWVKVAFKPKTLRGVCIDFLVFCLRITVQGWNWRCKILRRICQSISAAWENNGAKAIRAARSVCKWSWSFCKRACSVRSPFEMMVQMKMREHGVESYGDGIEFFWDKCMVPLFKCICVLIWLGKHRLTYRPGQGDWGAHPDMACNYEEIEQLEYLSEKTIKDIVWDLHEKKLLAIKIAQQEGQIKSLQRQVAAWEAKELAQPTDRQLNYFRRQFEEQRGEWPKFLKTLPRPILPIRKTRWDEDTPFFH
jgi:hypothetical protein